jgi:hypothetical protein
MKSKRKVAKAAVMLLVAAFVVMVVGGIYTALKAAPGYTLSTSGNGGSSSQSGADDTGSPNDGGIQQAAGEQSSLSEGADDSAAQAKPGATAQSSGGANDTSAPAAPPASSTSAKTYYPAWDEWVVEGHWETQAVAAVYGQRDVYGSICNTCGADISGFAAQHLKDTRHSGYHEGVVGSESYVITPASTKRVWIDTSHWVHHPACWK